MSPRILLVSDQPGDARSVQAALAQAGGEEPYQLVPVRTIQLAVRELAHGRIDAALLDPDLPDANPLDAVHRASAAAPDVPLVVYTDRTDRAFLDAANRAGAHAQLGRRDLSGDRLAHALKAAGEQVETRRSGAVGRPSRAAAAPAPRVTTPRMPAPGARPADTVPAAPRPAPAPPVPAKVEPYRTLHTGLRFGLFRLDAAGRFLDANPALSRLLRFPSPAALVGVAAASVFATPADCARLLERATREGEVKEAEAHWLRQDGDAVTVRLAGWAVHDAAGGLTGFEFAALDESDRRETERRLRQAERLEAVGRLAGGIAHDFNNVLTIILAHSELIAAGLRPDQDEVRTDLEELRRAARRGTRIVKQLLGFSRRDHLSLRPVNLARVLSALTPTLRGLLPGEITLEVAAESLVPAVRADPGAIEQIVLNLASNARDAMPQGGRLLLSADTVRLDPEYRRVHGWGEPGEYVLLVVSDTGTGMDERTRARIFEPFFSTKTAGVGTGLGMAMVYGLVKQHGGFVSVYSEPQKGTTVKVYLPVSREGAPASPRAEAPVQGGHETILLVEDEESIQRAARRVLEQFGYRVLVACDGEEALAVLRTAARPVDLIVTDVIMPRMDGPALYQAVRANGTLIRFLFASGYTEREIGAHALEPGLPFIQKPWTLGDFLRRVREVLDMK